MEEQNITLDFSQKPQQEKPQQADESRQFAFGKMNFILIGISMLIVVIGFLLMTGGSSTEQAFNPDIFSTTRIKVAPVVCLVGFVSIIAGIMYKGQNK